jgi:hypothetical protein
MDDLEERDSHLAIDEEEIQEMAFRLISQIVALDFQKFLELAGPEKVLSAYQPIGEYAGRAVAHNFRGRLNITDNGIDALAIPLHAFVNNLIDGRSDPVEIREFGAVARFTSCPLAKAGAPPELCVAVSHNAAIGLAKEINPAFEIIYTHHLTIGDPYCRYVVKRKLDRTQDLENVGKLRYLLPSVNLPKDEIQALTSNFTCSIWMNTIRAMVEVLGAETTLALVESPSVEKGKAFGNEAKLQLGLFNQNVMNAENCIEKLGFALSQDHEQLEIGIDNARTIIRGCALSDGPIEACKQFESVANGICQSIDPSIEFSYEQMRTRGDESCIWKIHRMSTNSNKKSNRPIIDDPARMLAWRFAAGEITQEEFDERMTLFRKHEVVK